MTLQALKEQVLEANLELVRRGLVLFTFGNASGIDSSRELVAIKPSGVPYETMKPSDIVVVTLAGKVVEGSLRPSSDLPTHLVLYRAWESIGGVVHTHSGYATSWAQAQRGIPCLGTTHADYFCGEVPVTAPLTDEEIANDYEANTGHAIVRRLGATDPAHIPAILVANHAPFTWGATVSQAAYHAVVLEEVARLALQAHTLNPGAKPISQALLQRHFIRKHGRNATYGQSNQ